MTPRHPLAVHKSTIMAITEITVPNVSPSVTHCLKNPLAIPKSTAETTIMILHPVIVDALFFCIGNILLRLDEELQNRMLFQLLVHVHMGLGPFELGEQHRVAGPV